MSFKKYSEFVAEQTIKPMVQLHLDEYKDHLVTQLSGLAIKNNALQNEVVRNLISFDKIKGMLKKLEYPKAEAFCIAVRSTNTKNIQKNLEELRLWCSEQKIESLTLGLIEAACENLNAKIYGLRLEPEDIDSAIDVVFEETSLLMQEMIARIEKTIASMEWIHPIKIKPIFGSDLKTNKALVEIGGMTPVAFELSKNLENFEITNIQMPDLPEKIKDKYMSLIDKIKNNPLYKQTLTFYMNQPASNRGLFENKRIDLGMGIIAFLPKDTILSNLPLDETQDVWKVKVYNDEFLKVKHEGDYIEYKTLKETPLRWIEKVSEAKHEG